MPEFLLTGPRGDNPLGFLTALGALITLEDAGHDARLAWNGVRPRLTIDAGCPTEEALVEILHSVLHRKRVAGADETEQVEKELKQAKASLKKKKRQEVEMFERTVREMEVAFKGLLARSGADPSVTLGRNLNMSNIELIRHARLACEQSRENGRRWADLTAAFGVGDPSSETDRMLASPWALVSGQQEFLGNIEQLMIRCTADHLYRALFGPWELRDKEFSLRLDASEDRRYALMAKDPTRRDNAPPTLWGANRLAFEALRSFPAMPVRGGMGVRGWRPAQKDGQIGWREGCRVRWPLWDPTVGVSVLSSLLGLGDLWSEDPSARVRLRGFGVRAVMESVRISVRDYGNLTAAAAVWTTPAETS
jgi:hypothetical protein